MQLLWLFYEWLIYMSFTLAIVVSFHTNNHAQLKMDAVSSYPPET